LCDLPYGQTARNKWDTVIPFDKLWEQYNRIIKDNGAIVLFANGMFTADLMQSNKKMWKYNLVWDKILASGHLNAKKMPMRQHEDICVFYKKPPTYNPQMTEGEESHSVGKAKGVSQEVHSRNTNYGEFIKVQTEGNLKYPKSILTFQKPHPSTTIHPTQKPVELCEWIINTYTNKGETVLDNCIGSGSTIVACINTQRNYIGFELEHEYYKLAEERIHNLA
jgi:site-specific DNA-methyltransferase (adenine-specific)